MSVAVRIYAIVVCFFVSSLVLSLVATKSLTNPLLPANEVKSNRSEDEMLILLNDQVQQFNIALDNYVRSLGANDEQRELLDRVRRVKTLIDNEVLRHNLKASNVIDSNRSLRQLLKEDTMLTQCDNNDKSADCFGQTFSGRYWKATIAEYATINYKLEVIKGVLERNQANCDRLQSSLTPMKQFQLMSEISKQFYGLIGRFSENFNMLMSESIQPIDQLATRIQSAIKKWPHLTLLGNIDNDSDAARFTEFIEQYFKSNTTTDDNITDYELFQLNSATFPEKYKDLARNIMYWNINNNNNNIGSGSGSANQVQAPQLRPVGGHVLNTVMPDMSTFALKWRRPCPYEAVPCLHCDNW